MGIRTGSEQFYAIFTGGRARPDTAPPPAHCCAASGLGTVRRRVRTLRKNSEITQRDTDDGATAGTIWRSVANDAEGEGDDGDDAEDLPGVDCAAIDAVLA